MRDAVAGLAIGAFPLVAAFAHSQVILPAGLLALLGLWRVVEDGARAEPGKGIAFGGRSARPRVGIMTALALLFAAWALLSLTWTPADGVAWRSALTLAVMPPAGLLLCAALDRPAPDGPLARWGGVALAFGLVAGALALGLESAGVGAGGGEASDPAPDAALRRLIGFNAGVTVWVLLLWPALVLLRAEGRGRLALGVALAVALGAAFSASESAKVALVAGGLCWLLARLAPGATLRGLCWGSVLVLVVHPLVMLGAARAGLFETLAPHLPVSLQHRLHIWRFSAEHILSEPLFGWGISAARAIGDMREAMAVFIAPGGWQDIVLPVIPLHPHNMPLQIWLELGAVGVVPVAAALILAGLRWGAWGRAGDRKGAEAAPFLAGLLAAGLCLSLVSYSLWQGWVLTSGLVAAGLMRLGLVSRSAPADD